MLILVKDTIVNLDPKLYDLHRIYKRDGNIEGRWEEEKKSVIVFEYTLIGHSESKKTCVIFENNKDRDLEFEKVIKTFGLYNETN